MFLKVNLLGGKDKRIPSMTILADHAARLIFFLFPQSCSLDDIRIECKNIFV